MLLTLIIILRTQLYGCYISADDLQQLLTDTKSKLIYCGEENVEVVSKAAPAGSKVVVSNTQQHGSSYIDYSSLVKDDYTASFQPFKVTDVKEHIPVLLFSSGTTGKPKGILVTNVGLLRLAKTYVIHKNIYQKNKMALTYNILLSSVLYKFYL